MERRGARVNARGSPDGLACRAVEHAAFRAAAAHHAPTEDWDGGSVEFRLF